MHFRLRGATIMGNNIPQFTGIGNGTVFRIPIPFLIILGWPSSSTSC